MINPDSVIDLILHPDVTPDQYQDVRIVTIKSEYARLMWEVATQRVGFNKANIVAEIERILINKEIELKQFVSKQDDMLTVCVNVDSVTDDTWFTAIDFVSQAVDVFQQNPMQKIVRFGEIIPIQRTDLPWFGYH